jgi:hypothetical protein
MKANRSVARAFALVASLLPLVAAAAAGQFTFISGQVTLTKANGQASAAARGASVDPGDRITTGADGMAQLTMVDQARLSLRPNTQFVVEQYPQTPESTESAVLNLVRGTLRTFTSLLSSANRDRFVMKTRVATVGIRGSGNILYYCEEDDCDPSVTGEVQAKGNIAVNHTIEGSHVVTNIVQGAAGLPAQQGGAQSVITGPGQTVVVLNNQPPRYIPTPAFIANAATNMTNKSATGQASEETSGSTLRPYAPGEVIALSTVQPPPAPLVGNNGLGFPLVDASGNLAQDPTHLNDIVIGVGGGPLASQATAGAMTLENDALRAFRAYPEVPGGVVVSITGGTLAETNSVALPGNGGSIVLGRWDNASISFGGAGATIPGGVHWIYAPSGYPMYLSDVLTGSATYTLAGHTTPTNQAGTAGTLNSATLDVNFSNRTANVGVSVSIPGAGGGNWNMGANNVPLALNSFFASTSDRLTVTNGSGQSSATNNALTGSISGSLVGTGLSGAILGYGLSDHTASDPSNWAFVTGVAAFTGPSQDALAQYREGRISDPGGTLTTFVESYATTNRPDEVVLDTQNRVTAFTAPYANLGSHAAYNIGSAQAVESGFDPETGMVWGRWSGGTANVGGQSLNLNQASLHYIFAGTQTGPVALPLTGTATYDVIGSTSPTDAQGHVGHFNTATLNADFSNRTASAAVNFDINGQTWNGSANGMPIYRDQYFSAYTGTPVQGLPNPAPLVITCSPNCGGGATGSFDGFFTGRDGNRAGMMYNLGGNQGAIAFGRRTGG